MKATRSAIEGYAEIVMRRLWQFQGQKWRLSSMNPGDGRRYQLQRTRDDNGGIEKTLPYGGHWPARQFMDYLEGLRDGLEHDRPA